MPPPSPVELSLVARANQGEEAALVELYRAHRDWVVALATKLTGSREDALDVLQETFAYLFGKFLTCNLRGFLFPVVRNLSISLIRKRARVVELDQAREEAAGRLTWLPEPVSDIERMVAGLPEGQRQVVLLRFALGFRLEEIAESLDLPLGTVKSRLHNALKTLRSSHEERNEGER